MTRNKKKVGSKGQTLSPKDRRSCNHKFHLPQSTARCLGFCLHMIYEQNPPFPAIPGEICRRLSLESVRARVRSHVSVRMGTNLVAIESNLEWK